MPLKYITKFIKLESSAGIILVIATIIAMLVANSKLAPVYNALLDYKLGVTFGNFTLAKPFLIWINDGLMTIFFLLVGLELKREIVDGHLSEPAKVALPCIAALGGIIIPTLIFIALNHHDKIAMKGWAIPCATDIAFSLAILSLLGSKIPRQLKIYLTALAIIDDLVAILIIAAFYSGKLSIYSIILADCCLVVLAMLNLSGVYKLTPYLLVGFILWVCVLQSGVHATLAGVALAFTIPVTSIHHHSPLKKLENSLHPWVVYGILPIFAFTNSGVSLKGFSLEMFTHPVPLGIALGLFFGKQIGVFGFTFAAIKLKIAELPKNTTWLMLYGTAIVCGIGYTMSLFIGGLAYDEQGFIYHISNRVGILTGSFLSAVVGYLVLRYSVHKVRGANSHKLITSKP